MIELSAGELAGIVGGRVIGDDGVRVRGVVQYDSRAVGSGDVFFAMRGTVTDGHAYADAAVGSGAALVVAEEPLGLPVPVVVVSDTLAALAALAREVVARVRAAGRLKVIAVTGSNGKTTTKHLLAEILAGAGPTVAPQGSYNNQVGAPIAMLRVDERTEFLVVEMGADSEGDIARLVGIVTPDVAIVLKVGLAHVGVFGGQEAIARAKAELVRELPASAVAILNADDAFVAAMAAQTAARVVTFGRGASDWRIEDTAVSLDGTSFVLAHAGERLPVRMRVIGEHHTMNAVAAIAAADAVGVPPVVSIPAVEAVDRAERWRMERIDAPEGFTVINDAYNASPDAMAAALRTLAEVTRGRARSIAVLGHMAELGEWATEEHDRVGRLVVRLNIDQLFVVGELAKAIHLAATQEGSWDGESVFVSSADDAYDVVRGVLRPGDVVLVKSSYAAGLRRLGDRIAGVAG